VAHLQRTLPVDGGAALPINLAAPRRGGSGRCPPVAASRGWRLVKIGVPVRQGVTGALLSDDNSPRLYQWKG
jgi:hypothetical protein